MSLILHRITRTGLIAFAVLAGGVAASAADEPNAPPAADPIDLEFESLEAPGLKDLRRAGQYPPPTFSTPGGLPPEILRVQQELGGSVVNQFPALQSADAPSTASPPSATNRQAVAAALRDAAWSMDSWANRLEALEAYDQADALRAHAQRLRVEARAKVASAAKPTHTAPSPAPTVEVFPVPPATSPTELR